MDKADRIADQVKRLATSSIIGRKEIRELPGILWDDEDVLDITQGTYNNGTGILVATQRRLVFVDKGLLYGLKVEDFPLDKISSIQYQTGLLLATVTIFTSGNKAEIKNVDKTKARSFAEGVRVRIAKAQQPAPEPKVYYPPAPAPVPAKSEISQLIEELEKLGALKDRGILTEEEFQAKKKQILGL
jgi:Bacterial PH domain/Short C-terminal domain